MATVIKLKRGTSTPSTSDIISGEVAVDTSAQKLYINDSGTIKEIGGGSGGGGGSQNVFATIAMPDGSTTVAADSTTDTLTLAQSGLISITGDSSSDTVTVSTVSSSTIPFLKADGSSSNIDLQTSGSINEVISNLHIPFTKADGSDVTTLVVA